MLLKAIIQGGPGAGKTSLLVSAANAGYRIVVADFDHCPEPLLYYTSAEGRERVTIVPFDDEVEMDEETGLKRKAAGMKAFERFLYSGKVGKEAPYGAPKEWGAETILVVDTITAMGECAEARALSLNPLTREGRHLWAAAQDQEAACELMLSKRFHCHIVVLSHVRLISPKAESGYKDETALQIQVKRERAALEETGFFPTMVTPGIARNFVRHFPFSLLAEEDGAAKNPSRRVLRTKPVPGYQIKCPLDIADKLPIETALATILSQIDGRIP